MNAKEIVNQVVSGQFAEMKESVREALAEKANAILDVAKESVARRYFGLHEEKTPADQGIDAAKEDDKKRDELKKAGKTIPKELTGLKNK